MEAALQPVWAKSNAFYADFAAGRETAVATADATDVRAVAAAVNAAHALSVGERGEAAAAADAAPAQIETLWESHVDDAAGSRRRRPSLQSYDDGEASLEQSFESFDSTDDDDDVVHDRVESWSALPALASGASASGAAAATGGAGAAAESSSALFVEPSPIQRGTYPLAGQTNCYCDGDGTSFQVRGPTYLDDRIKVQSKPSLFVHEALSVFKSEKEMRHIVQMSPTLSQRVARLQATPGARPANPSGAWNDMLLVVVWRVPGPPFYSVTHVFRRAVPIGVDAVADHMLDQLVSTCNGASDDEWRKERFKFIPSFVELPYLVGMAFRSMGGARPALLANKIDHDFIIGPGECFCFFSRGVNVLVAEPPACSVREPRSAAWQYSPLHSPLPPPLSLSLSLPLPRS